MDIPVTLVPQHILPDSGSGWKKVRWISKVLYTQIQCLVVLEKLQNRVTVARIRGYTDDSAEALIGGLLRCTNQYDLEQWLQNYCGRALLSCTHCGVNDVPLVLEMSSSGRRVRLCYECVDELEGRLTLPPTDTPLLQTEFPKSEILMLPVDRADR